MHRFNIKSKSKKFKINPCWEVSSEAGWTLYKIKGANELKMITKPEWGFYIVFQGDIIPFEVDTDKDEIYYIPTKQYRFSPAVRISRIDSEGWYHIKTEAGTFKVRFNVQQGKK